MPRKISKKDRIIVCTQRKECFYKYKKNCIYYWGVKFGHAKPTTNCHQHGWIMNEDEGCSKDHCEFNTCVKYEAYDADPL